MDQTEKLINVGKAYIDALNSLSMDHPEKVANILDILDCVHPEPGYHLGIYIEKPSPNEAPTHMCDQAWFICYRGNHPPITRMPYRRKNRGVYNYGDMCYLRFTFDFFNHLSIKPTTMGAWQAYLLSIAKTLLPFSGGLYYTKRKLIFSHEQLRDIFLLSHWERMPELANLKADVSPSVQIKDKQAIVSCCHWNDWGGLIRESAKITFFNGKVYLLDDFSEQVLFKYNCGIRF